MDAEQALADLTEISSQVRTAVVVRSDGSVEAAQTQDEPADALAGAARELLDAAGGVRSTGDAAVTQLEAATRAGSVFVVRDGERIVAATTGSSPTVGLVFYDLKTCLRTLSAGPEEDGR